MPRQARARRPRWRSALAPEQQALHRRAAAEVYNGLCISCHAPDGTGVPLLELKTTMAPPLAGSPRVNGHRDYIINAVLYGLTGPVEGRTYSQVMIPMGTNDDEWVASVASYVRQSFGNIGGFVTPADVARVRAATRDRKTPWDVDDAEGVAALAAREGRLDPHGEPQFDRRGPRPEPAVMEQRGAAAAGHVVPGRIAEARLSYGGSVRIAGRGVRESRAGES